MEFVLEESRVSLDIPTGELAIRNKTRHSPPPAVWS